MPATPTDTPSLSLVRKYVLGMNRRGELIPGGDDKILLYLSGAAGAPAAVLRKAIAFIDGAGSKYLDPAHAPAATEWPVRTVVNRLVAGGYILKGSADALVTRFAADFAGVEPGLIGERLIGRLEARENWNHLVAPPAIPIQEQRVANALRTLHDTLLPGVDVANLVKVWSNLVHAREQHKVNAEVFRMITSRPDLVRPDHGIDARHPSFQDPARKPSPEPSRSKRGF